MKVPRIYEGVKLYDEANGRTIIVKKATFGYYDCLVSEPLFTDDGIETEKMYNQGFSRRELERFREVR